jgi:hypothetical protein
MPRSANNRSAAAKIASRVPVDRSLRRTLAAVTASVNTRLAVKSSSLFNPVAPTERLGGVSAIRSRYPEIRHTPNTKSDYTAQIAAAEFFVEARRAQAVAQLPPTIGLSLTPTSRIRGVYNSRTAAPIDS